MTKTQLMKEIARLESINDQLATEITYVDYLMKIVGFAGGMATIKATAEEIIAKGYSLQNMDFGM